MSLYPFVLIFLTYVLVTLYDKKYRILVWAWKPFKHCLKFYRKQFNVKASLSHTFATFITLSSVKTLGVCFDILAYTNVYIASGTKLKQQFLYYDANIEFFGHEHLLFAVLALFVGFAFVFLPFLLLVLYPCGCFQQCLSRLKLGGPALHIFMDVFQGPYRTEPRDLRYFSAYYLFLRFCVLALLVIGSSISSFFFIGFLLVIAACVLAVFQPYKNHSHNKLDQISLLITGCLSFGIYAAIMASVFDYYVLRIASALNVCSIIILILILIFGLLCSRLHLVVCSRLHTVCSHLHTVCSRYLCKGRAPSSNHLEGLEGLSRDNDDFSRDYYPPLLNASQQR